MNPLHSLYTHLLSFFASESQLTPEDIKSTQFLWLLTITQSCTADV